MDPPSAEMRGLWMSCRLKRLASALWVLVAGLILLYLVVFSISAAGRVLHPLEEFTYGESWVLDDARRIAHGQPLYTPNDQIPLTQTAYAPLYYVAVGELQRLIGDGGYAPGRALSLLATLAGAAALAFSVHRLSGSWWAGWLAAGLFLTQNLTVLLWAPMHRVDPLALAFSLLGLALMTAGRPTPAALVFLLSTLTKQTYVIAAVAACLALWPCRRAMLGFAGIYVGGLVVAIGVAERLTGGWFLWHTVLANSNEGHFDTFARLMGSFLQYNGLPVLVAAMTLTLPGVRGERVWRLYFIGGLAILATIAKIGASSNYWLELSAATAVLLALAACRFAVRSETQIVAPAIIAGALLIAVPGYQAAAIEGTQAVGDALWPPTPTYLSLVADVGMAPHRVEATFVARVANDPGELLTDNPGLAVAAGKRISYEFQIFQLLRAEGQWSDEPIVRAIQARRFALAALMHPLDTSLNGTRWTPAIRDAMLAAYVPAGVESGFWLYRPSSAAPRP